MEPYKEAPKKVFAIIKDDHLKRYSKEELIVIINKTKADTTTKVSPELSIALNEISEDIAANPELHDELLNEDPTIGKLTTDNISLSYQLKLAISYNAKIIKKNTELSSHLSVEREHSAIIKKNHMSLITEFKKEQDARIKLDREAKDREQELLCKLKATQNLLERTKRDSEVEKELYRRELLEKRHLS